MIPERQEQYNKIISQNNIIEEVSHNNDNYRALFELALPLQLLKQEGLLLDKINDQKVKKDLLNYFSLEQVRNKIQSLTNSDQSVVDLKETFGFFKNIKRDNLKYKSFLQFMKGKVKNQHGFTLSDDYITFLRIASKCHKPKRREWKMRIQTRPELLCRNCGKDIVNKQGQLSHQKACPSIKRENTIAKTTSIKKNATKANRSKRNKQIREQSDQQA